jgi:hypothetical protein
MGHWSTVTVGFEVPADETREHQEVDVEVESAVRSATSELPIPHGTQYKAATGCFHVNCSEWLLRDDQETVDPHPDALEAFLDVLTFSPGVAENLTYAAVVDSEDTGNSHRVTVYDVGDYEPAEQVATETCYDGFDPELDLHDEFGLTHRVRV